MRRDQRDCELDDGNADDFVPLIDLHAIVDAFHSEHHGGDPVAVLRELVERPEDDDVLAEALARCWGPLREQMTAAHGADEREINEVAAQSFLRRGDDAFLCWLALTLTADVVRPTRIGQLRYLLDSAAIDPYLLRHILAPSPGSFGDSNDNQPPWSWKRVLVNAKAALDDSTQRLWYDSGRELARQAMASVSAPQFLATVRRLRGVHLTLLPHLARLDRDLAFQLGGDRSVVDERALPNVSLLGSDMFSEVIESLTFVAVDLLDLRPVEVGKIIGRQIHIRGLSRTRGSVAAVLGRSEAEMSDRLITAVALLWADLHQLVHYENSRSERWKSQDQIRGVLARLTEHVSRWPEAWALSAHDILHDAEALGRHCTDLLAYAATGDDRVRAALTAASSDTNIALGDLARGIDAYVGGTGSPGEAFRQWAAGTAAQAFDGTTMSPRPLSSMSRTWLGSLDLEDALAKTLRDALWRFGDWLQTQGGAQEETGTGTLLTRIEAAFEEARLRLAAGGRTTADRWVSVSQRPIAKSEEQQWGCDIALLLDVELPGWVRLHSSALVQMKKSKAIGERHAVSGRPRYERWRIDLAQLRDLLASSEASFYWLLMSSGEVLCVRALWLSGLVAGNGAGDNDRKTQTIGYEDIRHASIALDQFIPELFLKTWVGDARDSTLAFARGEGGIVPRHLFEISVRLADQRR